MVLETSRSYAQCSAIVSTNTHARTSDKPDMYITKKHGKSRR